MANIENPCSYEAATPGAPPPSAAFRGIDYRGGGRVPLQVRSVRLKKKKCRCSFGIKRNTVYVIFHAIPPFREYNNIITAVSRGPWLTANGVDNQPSAVYYAQTAGLNHLIIVFIDIELWYCSSRYPENSQLSISYTKTVRISGIPPPLPPRSPAAYYLLLAPVRRRRRTSRGTSPDKLGAVYNTRCKPKYRRRPRALFD